MESFDKIQEEIQGAVLSGDEQKAASLAIRNLQIKQTPSAAITPFVQAIRHAGDLFDQGEFFLPQLLLSARAMQAAMDVLFPKSNGDIDRSLISRGTVLAGTIQGDIHEIGKNLVCALLSAHGFQVTDLGADVSLEVLIAETRKRKPDFLVLSALLTTTMINQKKLIDLLSEQGLRDKVKVLVGGAPVTEDWAKEIGADGYAPDAARAVNLAIKLLDS